MAFYQISEALRQAIMDHLARAVHPQTRFQDVYDLLVSLQRLSIIEQDQDVMNEERKG